MADEVTLYADGRSPFVCRVKIALNMKGIKYKNLEEDLSNKSSDLLNHNPVHKKVPVLVHSGNPVSESLVIVEYIDDVWKGIPTLPQDPYENELTLKGKKFFGGDSINLVDLAADFLAYWLKLLEEATEIKFVTRDKFPKITEWANRFVNCQLVQEILPPRATLLAYYKKRFGKT